MEIRQARSSIEGFGSYVMQEEVRPNIKEEYALKQARVHSDKVFSFLMPILKTLPCDTRSVLDVGCGVGLMVTALNDLGYEAYGVDLPSAVYQWKMRSLPVDRFFVVDRLGMQLPFHDNSMDVAYSLGVIEHVGTTDGHADRRPDYHKIRKQWLLEIYRVVKKGGYLIIGGPNKSFPIDTHGPDSQGSRLQKWLHTRTKLSIHKVWGDHFLWSYADLKGYVKDVHCDIKALSMKNYYSDLEHVPALVRPFFECYLSHLPAILLQTGLNPWMITLIRKK